MGTRLSGFYWIRRKAVTFGQARVPQIAQWDEWAGDGVRAGAWFACRSRYPFEDNEVEVLSERLEFVERGS